MAHPSALAGAVPYGAPFRVSTMRFVLRAMLVSASLAAGATAAASSPAAPAKQHARKDKADKPGHEAKRPSHEAKKPSHEAKKPSHHEKAATASAAKAKKPHHEKHASAAKPSSRASTASASEAPVGPHHGAGTRRITAKAAGTSAETTTDPKKAEHSGQAARKSAKQAPKKTASHRGSRHRGRPPRHPKAALPAGVPEKAPDEDARHAVAGGPTDDDLKAGKNDPELRALRAADKVLFPKPLDGARPGWSWGLPKPVEGDSAEIQASGLPPTARVVDKSEDERIPAADAKWLKTLTMPNLPVRMDERVIKYLKFYRDSSRGRAIAHVWAKKSGRYAPAIKAELAKAGLPTDLVWLSLIESGHNPTIRSPAGAAGLWQFIPESGRLYGLTVDRWVDERLDPLRSTQAAIRYLSDLHRRFGNWELAMAAYNMGYGGLSRAIRKFNTNDFWELSRYEAGIPWETTLYVPKILATAIVMNNKRAFGLGGVTPDPPVRFDTVLVKPGVSLDKVAAAAEIPSDQLEKLNPDYLAARTPPEAPPGKNGMWPVRVPAGKGVVASQKLAKVRGSDDLEPYVVRFGDTVRTIAAARGTSEYRIRHINGIGRGEALPAGTVLLVPPHSPGASDSDGEEVVVVPPREFRYRDRRRVFYKVLAGDTLGRIARAFRVTRSELQAWNSLDRSARLQSGMVLQVFVEKHANLSHVRHINERETRVLVAGTHDFFDYFEGQKGKRRMVVSVKKGDTLRGIGKRYGMSVGWMERVNRCSRRKKLKPGDKLVVYVDRGQVDDREAGDEDGVKTSPLSPAAPPRPDALPPIHGSASTAKSASDGHPES